MTNAPNAAAILRGLLARTRDDEVDCDYFFAHLAPFLDGRIDDPALLAKLRHHAEQCAECDEELAIVKRSL